MPICRDDESKVKYIEIKIPQMLICADQERKVKYTELKYCRCQYARTSKESKS